MLLWVSMSSSMQVYYFVATSHRESNTKLFLIAKNKHIDQHFLLALIAPRKLFLSTAHEDIYSDPKGEFLALKAALPVFKLYKLNIPDISQMPERDKVLLGDIGFHLRTGVHDITIETWKKFLNYLCMDEIKS